MREVISLLKRLAGSWRADVLLAAVLAAWALAYLSVAAARGDQHWAAFIFVLPYVAAVAMRRRWPAAATAVAAAALLAVRPLGLGHTVESSLAIPFFWTPFLIAYGLGTSAGFAAGLAAAVLLSAALQIENQAFNPILEMITLGPWLAGRIAASGRRLAGQLRARNDELQAEQELFALESVRYERARIARELHDIAAHRLSVMIVQASAGQRVPSTDRDGIEEALQSVAEAAAQAQAEIGSLVELLGGGTPPCTSPGLQMVDELVRRASLAGLTVSCRFLGACDRLAPAASEAAYRVVQEALTNALKHAPGAPVDVTIREQDAGVKVSVVNAVPRQVASGLELSGGSYGLAGMRDRVTACGGSLTSGPTPAGGWHVSALLPAR